MAQVSLIIPNFNNAKFIGQCLESALKQTRPFDEIIVVDDASTDDSVAIIEQIRGTAKHLRLITLSRREGVSAARNRAIQAAASPFITTLDSDDFLWNERKNEREMRLIEAALPNNNVAAFSDVQQVSLSGEPLGLVSVHRLVRESARFEDLLCLRCFVPRDFTFSRVAYERAGGYNPGLSLYEDWDLKLRLSRFCDFRFTGGAGVAYRMNPRGLSRAPLRRHFSAMYEIIKKNTADLAWSRRLWWRGAALLGMVWFQRSGIKRAIRWWAVS
jgi:glycosyltransferase involved in cell wall biosynthesis